MKKSAAIALVTAGMFSAHASIVMETYNFANGGTPQDGAGIALADTRTISASAIQSISSISVSFKLSNAEALGAFNGDYYVTLQHDSGFSVLLNRVGRTGQSGAASFGYGDNGFNVTFSDSASNGDIHLYRQTLSGSSPGSPIDLNFQQSLTGSWAPDARNTSPLSVTSTDARTAFLSSFNGLAVNGSWTLSVTDFAGEGTAALENWGIAIAGSTVPEPATTAAVAAICLGAFAVIRRTNACRARK